MNLQLSYIAKTSSIFMSIPVLNLTADLLTMPVAMGFSSSTVGRSLFSERALKHSGHTVLTSISYQLHQADIENLHCGTQLKKSIKRDLWNLHAVPPTDSFMVMDASSDSPAQTIMLFYSAINDRNLKQLDKLIAEDCSFEDYTFTTPFQGRKEVFHFLEQLVFSMGQNMRFIVEHICQGNDYTATVNWHIDWNNVQVPFTRGCSCYSFSIHNKQLVIKKAQVLVESPIKLGMVALTAFKIVSSLFDAFPAATEWFLKSPHIVFHLLLKTYSIVINPIISPFLAWYIKLVNIAAYIISFTLKLLYHLAKIFHM